MARRRALIRWERERERRAVLAAKDPAFTGLRIARRVVVIDGEREVREVTIYETDSVREGRRKIREVLGPVGAGKGKGTR
jgi:hypothetical protein